LVVSAVSCGKNHNALRDASFTERDLSDELPPLRIAK